MNVLDKAEKALEFLKANETTAKSHELQTAAGTLGRCLGALGSRPNYARHYANLLHSSIPTLLFLASNNSAEVRLVGDEALNRAVVGGFAFHSHKTNILLQNQIDHTKNARWIRAALNRICLGECWLRPGVGKIRSQAQTLFPHLSEIVSQTGEIQLIVEALESNLPRILDALAEYTTDEEIAELSKALLAHVHSASPGVRRGAAACVARLAAHREALLTDILHDVFSKLWPLTTESPVVLGWFCVIKAVFQVNDITKFIENNLFTVQNYLELYHLCISYIEQTPEHNVQNCVVECLTTLLSCAPALYTKALLERHPRRVCLDQRERGGNTAGVARRFAPAPAPRPEPEPEPEPAAPALAGALRLGSLLQLDSPSLSCEDLTIQTPDSPESETELEINTEQLSKELTEKLQEYEETEQKEYDQVDQGIVGEGYKVNIGSASDDDVPLKFCARLLASKFLLTGNKGGLIADRSIRVSVKASALTCLSEILRHYPQAMTLYLDKDADTKTHNISGSTEATDSNQDNTNDFILERNVCYQESLSDSLSQDLLKSVDSSSQRREKLEKLEKSLESEQKSSNKDVQSAILDSKYAKSDLIISAMSQDTNMTNSNFTTNSNTTDQTTGYPMSSSGDILSSSIDLDMKFDHFGESTINLDTPKSVKDTVTVVKQKEPVKYETEDVEIKSVEDFISKEFECQHMCDVFNLLEGHGDPQIRGLVRVCVGNYLVAALHLAQGDYNRWCSNTLPKDIGDCICIEKLVEIVLKGLSDEIHSTVNHTLSSLATLFPALADTIHWSLLIDALNALVHVESNSYWLCKVNLCKLYEKMPYQKLFMLYPDYNRRSRRIMDTLIRLLADQDQKVRNAASLAIASIIPIIFPSRRDTPTTVLLERARQHTRLLLFDDGTPALNLVREIYFYSDLPEQLKDYGTKLERTDTLRVVVSDLVGKLMASSCKYYSQGLLETLQAVTMKYSPWRYVDAYSDQGILSFCLDSLESCNGTVVCRTVMLDICRMVYPVEIHNIMRHKTTNRDIFERESQTADKWQYLDNSRVATLAEKFLRVSLKMLNVLVHLIEEVNPNVHQNKSGIALPGSPVRRKTQDSLPRKGSTAEGDEKRKKPPAASLKPHYSGHFYTEPFYVRLYEGLRAVYNNHKINLDPKSSIFHTFLTTVLNCLAIQLELATEREFGQVTEEILYYLKVIMPLRADLSVFCVTQLLKCLFGTNMISQYHDFATIADKTNEKLPSSFFDDVMEVNSLKQDLEESRRDSVCSSNSQKVFDGNRSMAMERKLLIAMENFAKNKSDRKWSTNKKELERYIRLFEPVVIQSLKSYTMQNDTPLQVQVLRLLSQLLTLRVNYCMLDSDQVFIGFLMKQLDLVEQHEIPKCCPLVGGILSFLVALSSSRHHSRQLLEPPKLLQLCDGLLAAGAAGACAAGLQPVAARLFGSLPGSSVLGRAQQQEAQATKEVLFYMLQKTMYQEKVLALVSSVLALAQQHSESYARWCELAADCVLALAAARSIELETEGCAGALERLLDRISSDALLDQPRVEMLIRVLFQTPPESSAPFKQKLRYLAGTMVLLRKYLTLIPESEILLTIDYMKATGISPQSIFFNVKTDCDPLNVQNVNENCANLSPDVILVRFLFKTLTYAIQEVEGCYEDANLDSNEGGDRVQSSRLMYAVCVNIIVHVKHMLHLTNGCLFPLTSKTGQSLLHNEQSGLNTGLYSPAENIPLDSLNEICLTAARRAPGLTLHWSHLLIRLNFLSHKYWQKLVGFSRNLPLSGNGDTKLMTIDILQVACVLAYCEYFIDNGLSEAVHLTWLLVNRICILVLHWRESLVQRLLTLVQAQSGAAGLLLQAVAARCQPCLKEEFALNTFRIVSLCPAPQAGALVSFICRTLAKLEPALAARFAKLATDRCKMLKAMPVEQIHTQLAKEDVQVALELLQRDKAHTRYSYLLTELNSLASTVFDLSPLDLSQDRSVNPQYIHTTTADGTWLLNQAKSRCCISECTGPKVSKHEELARLLANLPKEDLVTIMSCAEFDRKLLSSCFKIACDNYLKDFVNVAATYESKETEKDLIREQQMEAKLKEEMTSSIDSNKLNVVNSTLHVFKKSDNKESKSQFFIPITDNENFKESFGNLHIADEETELIPPELSELYLVSAVTFDKSLTDVIRLFPKQNRPLSQSENFSLNVEQTIDRYTRRCHQVFQDKLFYQEFMTIQTIMTGFLDSLDRIIGTLDETDCDLLDKCLENILPTTLAKNIAIFSVISLQYLSFLIKNKSIVETPLHADVSFRVTVNVTDNIVIDNVIEMAVENVSKALSFEEIWSELNVDNNVNRSQSAISCLFAIVKYLVKDTQPLILHNFIQIEGPKPEMAIIGDKLVSLLQYWEHNVYVNRRVRNMRCMKDLETLTVRLSRLHVVSSIALIPPIAWSSVDMTAKKDFRKVDLPLQALQDTDVLEAFLFRVNLIGWSSKKQFEEMWAGLLGALQGNGPHWAVRGLAQLLAAAAPAARRAPAAPLHVHRHAHAHQHCMQRLRSILVGTPAYRAVFDDVNLERVPLLRDGFDGFHCAQYNTEYLKLASGISDYASFRIRRQLKRLKRNEDLDLNSCVQILMDVTTQMLDPKAETGAAARVALLSLAAALGGAGCARARWAWAGALLAALTGPAHAALAHYACAARALLAALALALQLAHHGAQELSSVHQKLLKALASSYSPLRQAALQGCLLQLAARKRGLPQELLTSLNLAVREHLTGNNKISLYEQCVYWTVLFTLVELGHPDLVNLAVDFILKHPRHYCTDLVVKGITTTLRQRVLPKDLKNSVIERLLDNMKGYSEHHAVQILMVHLFSADDKLLSPRLTCDVSNMDPDVLMNSMERITLLYKVLKQTHSKENRVIITSALKYFLRETLPPAATLSRVMIEFVECCKEGEGEMGVSERENKVQCSVLNAELVYEIFETSISQDQLPVLSGWIFEALTHLLNGKISHSLTPYCVLPLLVSASSNQFVRKLAPLGYYILKLGFEKCLENFDDRTENYENIENTQSTAKAGSSSENIGTVTERVGKVAEIFEKVSESDGKDSERARKRAEKLTQETWGIFKDVFHECSAMSFHDRRLLCVVALKSNFTRSQLERLRELCDSREGLDDLKQCLAV